MYQENQIAGFEHGPMDVRRSPSMLERLTDEKKHLEQRLEDINAALAALNAEPKIMEALELLSKVTHL